MKSCTFVLTLCSLTAGASLGVAGDTVGEIPTAGYHLKNRSSFTAPDKARAPFWPIGWTPSAGAIVGRVETATPEFDFKPDQFTVTSILIGSQSLATINGRSYGEGETLRTHRSKAGEARGANGLVIPPGIKIRVTRINDGEVTLQAGQQSINVPLKKPQLTERKEPEEDILSQDDR